MNMSMFKIRRKDGVFNTQPPFPPLLPFSSSPFLFLSEKQSTSTSSSPTSSSSGNRISPAILFVIVIVAAMVFISGLIHLLVRFLMKQRSSSGSESNRHNQMSDSDAFQRQLQQLFHLHDSGLDQAFIDALPVFVYEEIVGLKEPFDCAVCLCEFSGMDKLRLLPFCSHAFHIDCIDTWLLSNSTCPLCRGSLYNPGIMIENPVFNFEDPREEGFSCRGENGSSSAPKPAENSILNQRRVFSVRLGKFRSSTIAESARGETSSSGGISSSNISNLDARRCYSMGSYQYVVSELELQVALCPNGDDGGSKKTVKGMDGQNGNSLSSVDGATEGKRISISKGESFSVSKIWLWSKKTKYPSSSETQRGNLPISMSFPTKERDQVT